MARIVSSRVLRIVIAMFYLINQENGYPFEVNGEVRYFRGTVSIVSADNPASAALGGFKQSASAFRFCRHCMGTEQDIQTKVKPNALLPKSALIRTLWP